LQTACADAAIDVAHLAKRFGNLTAVGDLTLRVERGEVFGFLGPNGAGKTTAVKLLLGLTRPTAGSGSILGHPLGDRRTRKKIGYLPELFRYHDWLTAREELAFHARLMGLAREVRERDIREILALVGLSQRADDKIGSYSKGMQQRIGLAVALLGSPELVFLDEPTSALDPIGRHDVRELLHALRTRGTTVFLNSHLLSEVEQVCDRIAIVDRGRIVAAGPVGQIVGSQRAVRLMISADSVALPIVQRFGTVTTDGSWTVVSGIDRETIPELIRALVAADVCIYAVEQVTATLEQRFLEVIAAQ
jgi:ABC-2 type transport system ATP-binding protein